MQAFCNRFERLVVKTGSLQMAISSVEVSLAHSAPFTVDRDLDRNEQF